MNFRPAFLVLACISLNGCSYAYELLAVVRDGQLTFVVDPKSRQHPECIRQIDVSSVKRRRLKAAQGEDRTKTGYGTFWSQSINYDDGCANKFPVAYGVVLAGQRQLDRGSVNAKPLVRGIEYEISTTTSATGYGFGYFMIDASGRVINLPQG